MPTAAWITLLVLVATIGAFALNRWPPELIAFGAALVLAAAGVISSHQVIAGFSNTTVVMVGSLLIVSEALEASGVTAWVGGLISARAGGSKQRLLIVTMVVVAVLGILITTTGAVAALVGVVVAASKRIGVAPSRTLIPLAFAGTAGSLLVLIGAPVNVVIADAIAESGAGPVGFFDFALIGVPLLVTTLVINVLLARFLPHRQPAENAADLTTHGDTLAEHYGLDHVVQLNLPAGEGLSIAELTALAAQTPRVKLVAASREAAPTLTAIGDEESIRAFAGEHGLEFAAQADGAPPAASLFDAREGLAEIMIPPRSRYIDTTIGIGDRLGENGVVVLAAHRLSKAVELPCRLQVGDTILVEGGWADLKATTSDPDIVLVDSPREVLRQAVRLGPGSRPAIAILLVMVVVMAAGVVSPAIAALAAAGLILLTRVVSPQSAYRRISWSVVFLIAGMLPMSNAIEESGLADVISTAVVSTVGELGPRALLALIFVVTVFFGQLISNTATALIMIPIALSTAEAVGISATPVLVTVLIGCTAPFLTPIATPANTIVMGPGGYRFTDYFKLGVPLTAAFFVAAVVLVPLIWPF